MLGSPHLYEIMILERHLDTFGHVNNAVYLEILEEARWDYITGHGYGLKEVMATGIGPTILEINLRFQRELRNRQKITIKSWVESYAGKVGKFAQQILDEKGDVACDALFTIGLFDVKARRLIRPTPEWIQALGLTPADLEAE